jgi:ubiquinone/menaquinone biosynthesis C-methylase UbiE
MPKLRNLPNFLEIWKTARGAMGVRARYLYDLYRSLSKFESSVLLDIGTGLGNNALVFGERADQIFAIDLELRRGNVLKEHKKASLIRADARFLPFKEASFDTVLLISVLEHIADKKLALKDALRVLKPGREIVIQIPNRYSLIELHSALPMVFFVPARIRNTVLRLIGYSWVTDIDIPTPATVEKTFTQLEPGHGIEVARIIYPPIIVSATIRPIYIFLYKTRLLRLSPLGYLVVVRKRRQVSCPPDSLNNYSAHACS